MTKPNLKKLLEKTDRTLYIDDAVLKTAPSKVEGTFEMFTLEKYTSDDELQKEYESRGLVPADIETLVEHDSELDEKKWVSTHWKDKDGNWCFAAFGRWRGDARRVFVYRRGYGWDVSWWFAGVRKSLELGNSDLLPSEPLSLAEISNKEIAIDRAIKLLKSNGFTVTKEY